MLRTIDSPGVEISENDVSLRIVPPVGTRVLVHGFSPQGPTDQLITVSTKSELDEIFFGQNGPTNDAEKYFYNSCKEVLNSPATLMVTRLPYGSGGGYDIASDYSALAYPLSVWKQEMGTFPLTATIDVCPYFDPNCFTFSLSSNLTALSADGALKEGDFSTMAYYPSGDFLLTIGMDPKTPIGDLRLAVYTTNFMHVTTLTGYGFHDVEGICWVSGDTFAMIEERNGSPGASEPTTTQLHYLDYNDLGATFTAGVDTIIKTVTIDYYRNEGPEGIAYDPENGRFIFTREGNQDDIDDAFNPDSKRSIGVFTVATSGGQSTPLFNAVEKLSAYFPSSATRGADLTDCYYDQEKRHLMILSDRASAMFVTDLSGNVLATRDFFMLNQAEALTMDVERGCFYVGGEPAQIMKYCYGSDSLNVTQVLTATDQNIIKILPDSVTVTITHYLSTAYGFTLLSSAELSDDQYGVLTSNSAFVSGSVNYGEAVFSITSYLENVWNPISTVVDTSFNYLASSSNLGDLTYVETDDPYYIPLTETQYLDIKSGQVSWTINGGLPNTYANLGNAAFVVVNKNRTIIDEESQGYYFGITDNSQLEDGSYNSIELIRTVNENATMEEIPESSLGFTLSGTDVRNRIQPSISETVEQSYEYDFEDSLYNDTILMNLVKLDKDDLLYYTPVEKFIGSLEFNDKRIDPRTREPESFFVEDRINPKSNYLEIFSNNMLANQISVEYLRSLNTNLHPVGPYFTRKNPSNTLKHIGNLPAKIERALSLAEDLNTSTVDIVIGSGLETVWAYVADINGVGPFEADANVTSELADLVNVVSGSSSDFAGYHRTIYNLYNNFCVNTRRDCVHYSDPLRCVFIQGEKFLTLDRKDKNFTSNILQPIKNLYGAANSNYSAAYANWVKVADTNSGKFIWLPFSAWQAAITARTDRLVYPWTAPFGLNNGKVQNIIELAFKPNQKQQDALYRSGVNPVVFFSGDGNVTWGQKTLQTKPSAFDRLNVRKLFNVLERATRNTLRYYVGEPNTVSTRNNVLGVLKPLFELAKNNEGLYDYMLVCNEKNNTPTVIDNNELKIDVYIKAVRTAEFIMVTFHATRTDQNFSELIN